LNAHLQAIAPFIVELAALPDALPFSPTSGNTVFSALRARYSSLLTTLQTVPFTAPVRNDGYRLIQEWNPLAQRLYVPRLNDIGLRAGFDIAQIKSIVLRFVELAHEVCHIVLWEPFFTGHVNPLEDNDGFVDWWFLSEAFCFWYADHILLPDVASEEIGESGIARDSVGFGGIFNPRDVLADLGYHDDISQLEVVMGLLGFDSDWKDRHELDIRFHGMKKRLWSFRMSTEPSVRRWLELLIATGIRDRFYRSFCAVPGIPSTLSIKPESLDESDIRDFLVRVGQRRLQLVDTSLPALVPEVRLRRDIQARAYSLLQLQYALEQRHVATSKPDTAGILRAAAITVEGLLETLEQILQNLCAGLPVHALRADVVAVDERFASMVADCTRIGAFLARRELFAPDAHLARFHIPRIGLTKFGVQLADEDIRSLVRALAPDWQQLVAHPEQAGQLLACARALADGSAEQSAPRLAQFDAFFASELIRKHWSIELGELSFAGNRLRELLFEIA
jgi:hypothetical protein